MWDHLHGRPASPPAGDVDVIWFDTQRSSESQDRLLEDQLKLLDSSIDWSVSNQSRMHAGNHDSPYQSATDAMRFWPETATAVAARYSEDNTLEISAPHGLDDLYGAVLRPAPRFHSEKREVFDRRVKQKKWLEQWPLLRIEPG